MDLSFKTFKEFLAHDGSDSSDDEVFFAGKCKTIHYARRKTEEFDPEFRTNRKSIITSEDYFADQSRFSSGDGEIPVSKVDQPSGSCTEGLNGPHKSGSSDWDPSSDVKNVSFRTCSKERGSRLLSFQRFTSESGSQSEFKFPKSGGLENPLQCGVGPSLGSVPLAVPVGECTSGQIDDSPGTCTRECAVADLLRSDDRNNGVEPSSISPHLGASPRVTDLSLDRNMSSPVVSNEDGGPRIESVAARSPIVASHRVTDVCFDRDVSSPLRSPELSHDSGFSVSASNYHLGDGGQSVLGGNLCSVLCDSAFSPLPTKDGDNRSPISRSPELSTISVFVSKDHVGDGGLSVSGGSVLSVLHDLAVSPTFTKDGTDIRSPIRSPELSQLHDSTLTVPINEDHLGDCGQSVSSGSLCSLLHDVAFSTSTTDGPLPNVHSPITHSSLTPLRRLALDGIVHKYELSSNANIVARSKFFSQDTPSKAVLFAEVDSVTKTSENLEGLAECREQGTGNYAADARGSDVALSDVCLPSILVEHFEKCLDEDKIDAGAPIAEEGPIILDNSWNSPGCSGVPHLRLTTETSESEQLDSDSDCDFSLEALRRWNQHLMENDKKAKEGSSRLGSDRIKPDSPLAAMPLVPDQSSRSSELEERSANNRLCSVVLSPATSTRKMSGVREGTKFSTRTSRLEFELDLQIGPGTSSRPSPLVAALQLTPTKPGAEPEASPSNLECLDLSVDDRIPMDKYFAVMDKENRNLGATRKVPEKKTPTNRGALPMREISNSPTIAKSTPTDFAAPKQQPHQPSKVEAKKTGIPVIESRVGGNRHARCFNLYSTNKLQELKAKSMKGFQHIDSPVSQYIREYPVSPFIHNVRPNLLAYHKAEKIMPVKTFFPPPTPLAHLPVARYTEKDPIPRTVENPPRKYKYFPSPKTPLVIKHTGPSHVIPDVSCLHEDVLAPSSGQKRSRIPYLRDARTTGDVEESLWQVISPKKPVGKK